MKKIFRDCSISVNIQNSDFDINSEMNLIKSEKKIGAITNFIGVVRDSSKEEDQLLSLELEHYPGMTEKAIMSICIEAKKRWKTYYIRVIHRIGILHKGDNIVLVITASAHRKEAFKSAEYIMDFLKSRAPIWKKEHFKTHSQWVKSKEKDELALLSW